MIAQAGSVRIRSGLAPWQASLLQAAELLEAVPRGQLSLEVLTSLQRLLVPASNPYRGRLRDQRVVIWLDGLVEQELPAAPAACAMAAETLLSLEAALVSGVSDLDPIGTASGTAFHLLQAHPFVDGNGRVARAVASWLLMRAGYRLKGDPRDYCRKRKADCYSALSAQQGVPHHSVGSALWGVFFAGLVLDCYKSPSLDTID